MIPYIFNYSETIKINEQLDMVYSAKDQVNKCKSDNSIYYKKMNNGYTVKTDSVENSDPDDGNIFCKDTTFQTFSIEASDEDEIMFTSTVITEATENTDEDFSMMGLTMLTNSVESSDDDEILIL